MGQYVNACKTISTDLSHSAFGIGVFKHES